jgi:hypothetical protein
MNCLGTTCACADYLSCLPQFDKFLGDRCAVDTSGATYSPHDCQRKLCVIGILAERVARYLMVTDIGPQIEKTRQRRRALKRSAQGVAYGASQYRSQEFISQIRHRPSFLRISPCLDAMLAEIEPFVNRILARNARF